MESFLNLLVSFLAITMYAWIIANFKIQLNINNLYSLYNNYLPQTSEAW